MGWDIPQEKTVEVRKDYPKDPEWNKKSLIYCSKSRKSFNRIPKQYQSFMEKFLGRVIGEFVCDEIISLHYDTDLGVEPPYTGYFFDSPFPSERALSDFYSCLTNKEMRDYGKGKPLYGWHISDLKIYDKPKELYDYNRLFRCKRCEGKNSLCAFSNGMLSNECKVPTMITRPPQAWCYVEG